MDIVTVKTPAKRINKPQIYILKNIAENLLKVGYSINIRQRFKDHIGSNPSLKFITCIPVSGQKIELDLHQRLKPYRAPAATEWYIDSYELRDFLALYFVTEGITDEPNWAIICELPPGVTHKEAIENQPCAYADLPPYYLEQLKINAWLNKLSLKQAAKNMLMDSIEAQADQIDQAMAQLAARLNLGKSELMNGILDGTIKPL